MPQVSTQIWVPVDPAVAFAVSQTTGDIRMRWDPFIRSQHLIDAELPGKDVQTWTRSRLGPSMISKYSAYRPPTSVGITMVRGPWFFESFGGGWRFSPETRDGIAGCRATWKYTFTTQPAWMRRIAEPVGHWLLSREIEHRIRGWARGCVDPVILDAIEIDR